MKLVILKNDLVGGEYAEPYAGGAGVALFLLYHEFVSRVHVSDVDPAIYAFWDAALHHTDELCELINEADVSVETWEEQRQVLERCVAVANEGSSFNSLELGYATFFLNRTNRSGILSGGIIGGKNQDGKYKIDARFNKESLIRRIRKVGRFRNRISLYNHDAVAFIAKVLPKLPRRTLAYLDPPYYKKGQGLYTNYYEDHDHKEIADLVNQIRRPWIVSYDNVERIRELYNQYKRIEYSLSYSAQDRYKGREIIFFSDGLQVPTDENPAHISKERVTRQATLSL